jgi:hypothetical protein
MTLQERFWSKVEKTPGCWLWRGYVKSGDGYGRFTVDKTKRDLAHRVAYELSTGKTIGPRPMTIDHLCRNQICVNPKHLEVVTNKENILRGFAPSAMNARKTHCIRGHRLDGENLIIYIVPKTGKRHRRCRICKQS